MQPRTYRAEPASVLDDSKVAAVPGRRGFHGLEQPVRSFPGVCGVRVSHPPGQVIREHRHDWPYLVLPLLGGYVERSDEGEVKVAGPSVALHAAGTCHANRIGAHGMESVSLEFDPKWIRVSELQRAMQRSRSWIGGPVSVAARELASAWLDARAPQGKLATMTARFVGFALNHDPPTPPAWLEAARTLIDAETPPSTSVLARMLGLHPAWLARAYRRATGEGLRGTLHRRWVERAVLLLRESSLAQADIAADAGFCDQSHMIRVFRRVLGRTPSDVRADSTLLATLPCFRGI